MSRHCAPRPAFPNEGPPPRLVVAIPLNGLRDAVIEVRLRRPPERAQFRGADGIAAIVSGTVRDMLDVRFHRSSARAHETAGQIEIGHRRRARNVVDASSRPTFEYVQYCARVIFNVEPVANLQPVAVNRYGAVVQ